MSSSDQKPPNWGAMSENFQDKYFLKHEVKRLMRANDAMEWSAQLAYSFGFSDAIAGQEYDDKFCMNDVYQDQDDETLWTAQEGDQIPEDDETLWIAQEGDQIPEDDETLWTAQEGDQIQEDDEDD